MTTNPWHQYDTYDQIIISKYQKATDCSFGRENRVDHPLKVAEISDSMKINQILSLIDGLSPKGDMMISFADDIEYMVLDLYHGDSRESIEFYGNMIKTPDTSFYSEEEDRKKEKVLIDFLESLLG